MPKLTIVFFEAGGGHRNAANAIKTVIEQQALPWQVELLNLQQLLDQIDPLQQIANLSLQDGYNLLLRKSWTRFSAQMLAVLHALIAVCHHKIVRKFTDCWRERPADVVLSVIPNFNRALAESLRRALPNAKFVTLLTDFADYPPHFWIEPESQFLICGTDRAAQQAAAIGHDESRICRTSGMVLHPKFYQPQEVDIAAERSKLGLHPNWPTALVLFGGYGSAVMLKIAKHLSTMKQPLQLIFICGHNEKLAAALRRLNARTPIFVEGFTQRVGYYMSVSNFLIGKPGPGCIAEALHFKLPVVVECNSRTLPQERYNAQWVRENEVGIVLDSFDNIDQAVLEVLGPGRLSHFRTKVGMLKNRAIYEVVEILKKLMNGDGESTVIRSAEELASL